MKAPPRDTLSPRERAELAKRGAGDIRGRGREQVIAIFEFRISIFEFRFSSFQFLFSSF
jgi:hypothetical protein